MPVDFAELVRFLRAEARRDVLLLLVQHVDAEVSAGLDGLPGTRHLRRAEQHKRWVQRQRGERLAREPYRLTIMHGGDHGDTGTELPQHISECAGVDGLGHYLKPMLKSWPQRLTAVLSLATQSSSSTVRPS